MDKQKWKIVRAADMCGGRWAWMKQLPSGFWAMQGCVCHHPMTALIRTPVTRRTHENTTA